MNLHHHAFRCALALGLALTMFPAGFFAPISVNASSSNSQLPSQKAPRENVDSFIIEVIDGVTTCRDARPDEVSSTISKPGDGIPVKDLLPANLVAGGENAVNGLTINFNALQQLRNDPNMATVVAAFQSAAAVWTAKIKSPVTISIDIDYGLNTPGPDGEPFETNVLGSTSSRRTLIDYPGARRNLVLSKSAADPNYDLLPNSVVPVDVGNGTVVSVNRSVAFALGIPVTSPADQWVATMGFNKKFPYDFNPDDGIDTGKTDFIAVATHEIGHALGFTSGSGAGSTATVTLWDLFRLRPPASTGMLPTAQRVMSIGGPQVYFTGQTFTVEGVQTSELGLSTGGPDADDIEGDGRQSSHWKDNDQTGQFIGIMDPTIGPGVHEGPTDNDFMAIEAIGWNLLEPAQPPPAPPPPPAPTNDNFASARVISGCSGSVNGTNVGATKQSGEINHLLDTTDPTGGGSRSVWYQWQSPGNGTATITTAGSRFDTVLGIYTGTSVSSLTIIGQHDDVGGPTGDDKTSALTFTVSAGTIYRIAVDGYNNLSGGDMGPVTVNWSAANCSAVPQILIEQSGPVADQAAAVDSVLMLRDPFLVLNGANLINPASDRNTRVVIFVTNLLPNAPVVVNLIDSNNQSRDIAAQDVRAVPNFDFRQVTFRLPSLPAGTCKIKVISNGQTSNTATFRIRI